MADQPNTERNVLIAGAVLGVAAAALGAFSMMGSKVQDVKPANGGKASLEEFIAPAETARATVTRDRVLRDVAPEKALVNGKPRIMPAFYAVELWQIPPRNGEPKGPDGKPMNNVIDIYDATSDAIHPTIPNVWFLNNGIEDALSRADGETMDSDGDGFSNLEEFAAGTHPGKADSLPPLVHAKAGTAVKLEVVDIKKAEAVITIDSMFALDANPTQAGIKIYKRVDDAKPVHKLNVAKGDSFGLAPGDDGKRFTVLGYERKSFTNSMGSASEETVLKVRDNESLTDEKEFTIRAGRPRLNDKERGTANEKGRTIKDVAAVIRVTAGPKAGKPEGTVTVPLHGSFKVPGDEKLSCTLESVDANGSANIRPEGAQSPVNIPAAAK